MYSPVLHVFQYEMLLIKKKKKYSIKEEEEEEEEEEVALIYRTMSTKCVYERELYLV